MQTMHRYKKLLELLKEEKLKNQEYQKLNLKNTLVTRTIKIEKKDDIKKEIESILQQANFYAFNLAKTNKSKYRRILLIRKDHIENLEKIIADRRSWVVSVFLLSVANINSWQ